MALRRPVSSKAEEMPGSFRGPGGGEVALGLRREVVGMDDVMLMIGGGREAGGDDASVKGRDPSSFMTFNE